MSGSEGISSLPTEEESSNGEALSRFQARNDRDHHSLRCNAMNATPSSATMKDIRGRQFVAAVRTMSKLDREKCKRAELVAEESVWIGTLVTKMTNGERYMGHVVNFDEETGWFKIKYEDGRQEAVREEELHTLVTPPELVCEYLDRVDARKNEKKKTNKKKKKKKNKKRKGGTSTTSAKKAKEPKPSEAKCEENETPYVPLAIREKKKDVYVWY